MYCPWTAYVWPPGAATNTGAARASLGRYGTVTPFAGHWKHTNNSSPSSSDEKRQQDCLGSNLAKGRMADLLPLATANEFVPSWPPCNTRFLRPTRVGPSNGISIGSAVFAQLVCVPNKQTDTLSARGYAWRRWGQNEFIVTGEWSDLTNQFTISQYQ